MQFLQANVFNVDIFALQTGEPESDGASSSKLIAPLGLMPFDLAAGQRVTLSGGDPEQGDCPLICA